MSRSVEIMVQICGGMEQRAVDRLFERNRRRVRIPNTREWVLLRMYVGPRVIARPRLEQVQLKQWLGPR